MPAFLVARSQRRHWEHRDPLPRGATGLRCALDRRGGRAGAAYPPAAPAASQSSSGAWHPIVEVILIIVVVGRVPPGDTHRLHGHPRGLISGKVRRVQLHPSDIEQRPMIDHRHRHRAARVNAVVVRQPAAATAAATPEFNIAPVVTLRTLPSRFPSVHDLSLFAIQIGYKIRGIRIQ